MNDLIDQMYNQVDNDETCFTTPVSEEVHNTVQPATELINECWLSYLQWEQCTQKHANAIFEDCPTFEDYCTAVHKSPASMMQTFLSFAEGWVGEIIKEETDIF